MTGNLSTFSLVLLAVKSSFVIYGTMFPQKGEPSDSEFIKRAQQGDQRAFEALFDRYKTAMYRVAYRQLDNHQDSEDAVQDAIIRAYRAIGAYKERDNSKFSTWLCTIVKNIATDKRNARRPTVPLFEEISSPSALPHSATTDLDARIAEAMDTLSMRDRQLILLDTNGYEADEIARTLDIKDTALRKALSDARKRLRAKLDAPITTQPQKNPNKSKVNNKINNKEADNV